MTFPIDPIPILNQELQRLNCGGALLAISENGQITICSAGTLAGTDHDRPFYIYSISKTLTAAAILRLSEEGKLHLDAPLTTYLKTHPSIPDVTVRQLLNHTSGLSDYFSAPDYQKAVFASPSHPTGGDGVVEERGFFHVHERPDRRIGNRDAHGEALLVRLPGGGEEIVFAVLAAA